MTITIHPGDWCFPPSLQANNIQSLLHPAKPSRMTRRAPWGGLLASLSDSVGSARPRPRPKAPPFVVRPGAPVRMTLLLLVVRLRPFALRPSFQPIRWARRDAPPRPRTSSTWVATLLDEAIPSGDGTWSGSQGRILHDLWRSYPRHLLPSGFANVFVHGVSELQVTCIQSLKWARRWGLNRSRTLEQGSPRSQLTGGSRTCGFMGDEPLPMASRHGESKVRTTCSATWQNSSPFVTAHGRQVWKNADPRWYHRPFHVGDPGSFWEQLSWGSWEFEGVLLRNRLNYVIMFGKMSGRGGSFCTHSHVTIPIWLYPLFSGPFEWTRDRRTHWFVGAILSFRPWSFGPLRSCLVFLLNIYLHLSPMSNSSCTHATPANHHSRAAWRALPRSRPPCRRVCARFRAEPTLRVRSGGVGKEGHAARRGERIRLQDLPFGRLARQNKRASQDLWCQDLW